MKEHIKLGFVYTIEVVKDGIVVEREEHTHNLMPNEGMTHVSGVILKGASQVSLWYVGLYEGAYTPVLTDTMATFPGLAVETTAYTSGTRPAYAPGTVTNGNVDNASTPTDFTMNAAKTVYGGFISSASTKGGTAGVLISAVRFATPKVVESGSVLRVTAGFATSST